MRETTGRDSCAIHFFDASSNDKVQLRKHGNSTQPACLSAHLCGAGKHCFRSSRIRLAQDSRGIVLAENGRDGWKQ